MSRKPLEYASIWNQEGKRITVWIPTASIINPNSYATANMSGGFVPFMLLGHQLFINPAQQFFVREYVLSYTVSIKRLHKAMDERRNLNPMISIDHVYNKMLDRRVLPNHLRGFIFLSITSLMMLG